MSEYQRYEFQTVDRCLTKDEMSELRDVSTRAVITPSSFINEYTWGDLKADTNEWMENYFDGFLYYSNCGVHILKLRIPSYLLDFESIKDYFIEEHLSGYIHDEYIILSFVCESDNEGWEEEEMSLSTFLPLRQDLLRGDFRCLYLAWLNGLENEELEDQDLEPPVPPGLGNLTPTLINFADLLLIDPDRIEAAAKLSQTLDRASPQSKDLQKWVAALPSHEKESLLTELLEGSLHADHTAAILLGQRFTKDYQTQQGYTKNQPPRRTIAQLREESAGIAEAREKLEAKRKAEAHAKQQKQKQLERDKRLNEIMGRESILWEQIELLASEKKAASYKRAAELLVDLRDLATRNKSTDFSSKLQLFKQRHFAKRTFIELLSTI